METPIYDFLEDYRKKDFVRLHMPGHKGKLYPVLSVAHDITEIHGADSLFDADGIILKSEENASRLFKSRASIYSAGGSTLCIQTMLALAMSDKRQIVAVRSVHRSFIAACVLLGIEPVWFYPEYSAGFISGRIDIDKAEELIKKYDRPCFYVTSPDYLGRCADIKALADICHRHGGILIVDNAHGAHFAGTEQHPMICGADMCCDSAHKMLPALTGAAYLHINNERFIPFAKQQMKLFASTSPSYLIMASLDLCNKYIENELPKKRGYVSQKLMKLREKLSGKYTFYQSESFHLTILSDGIKLADRLRLKGIECEYSDRYCLVLLFSPENTDEDIEKTYNALESLAKEYGKCEKLPDRSDFPVMERVMPLREAAFSTSEKIPVENSVGRIAAAVDVPCPPAVPIAVCGERISEEAINIYRQYNIETVNVVAG